MTESKLVVTGDTADAVAAALRLVDAEKKIGEGAQQAAHGHKQHNEALEKTSELLGEIVTEAGAGLTALLSWDSVKDMFLAVAESAKKAAEAIAHLHEVSASGSTLPPYSANVALYDSENLVWGRKYGQDVSVIDQVRKQAFKQSPGADKATLDAISQQSLEFSKNYGLSPTDTIAAETELEHTWKGMSQKQAEGLIAAARDKAGVDPGELTPLVEKLSPTVQELGVSQEDTLAMIELFAQSGGATGKMAKGSATLLAKIPQLIKEGLIKNGSLGEIMDQFAQIRKNDPGKFAAIESAAAEQEGPLIDYYAAHRDELKNFHDQNVVYEGGKPVEQFIENRSHDPTVKYSEDQKQDDFTLKNVDAIGATPEKLALAERRRKEDVGLEYWHTHGPDSVGKEFIYRLSKHMLDLERSTDSDLNPRVQRRHQYLLGPGYYADTQNIEAHPNDGLPGFAPIVHPTTLPSEHANPGSPSRAGIIAGGGGSDAVVAAAKQAADASAQLFTALANERRPTTRPAPHAPGGFLGPQ